ncbi:MAG: hypothetical protein ACLFVQ_00930 [Chitinispirillaceae bacterium]
MRRISTDQIENGHISAREVCGPSGNILLSRGMRLTPAMGRRLKNWGIYHVFIQGEEEESEKEHIQAVSPEKLKSELMEKFSGVLDNPNMKKIFAAVYQHKLRKS